MRHGSWQSSFDAVPDIEQRALRLLLSGGGITCETLRAQLNHVAKIERAETGAGVYLNFGFRDDVQPLENRDSFQISGVFAVSEKCGEIGFLLFVKEGLIDFLEAYVYTDSYPSYVDCDFKLGKV